MSLPTTFFAGRQGGGGGVDLTVPNGAFMRVGSNAYFFDVETETSSQVQNYTSSPSDRFQFDPVTNYMIQEGDNGHKGRIYHWNGSQWAYLQQTDGYYEAYNGRTGWYFDSKNYNIVGQAGNYFQNIKGYVSGGNYGSTVTPSADTEDHHVFGDFATVCYYNSGRSYRLDLNASSGGLNAVSAPSSNNWLTPSYDARTNVKYIQPQSTTTLSYYRNNNCLGSLATSAIDYSHSTISMSASSAQFNATLIGFDETTGAPASNNSYYYYIGHASGYGSGWARFQWGQTTGAAMGSNTGQAFKMTPVYSFSQDAYYLFCENCVLKVPHLGNGLLSASVTQINYGFSANAWRGPCSSNAQGSISLVNRTQF